MNLHFILSMCLEVSQISLWGHFISIYLLCTWGRLLTLEWQDSSQASVLAHIAETQCSIFAFLGPLRYVCLSDGEENLNNCVLGALSAVSMAASIKQTSAFPVINIYLRCSSAVTFVLDDHMTVLGCQFPCGSIMEYFNWKRDIKVLGSAGRYLAQLWNANLSKPD